MGAVGVLEETLWVRWVGLGSASCVACAASFMACSCVVEAREGIFTLMTSAFSDVNSNFS